MTDRPAPFTNSGYCDNALCVADAVWSVAGGVQVSIDAQYHEVEVLVCAGHLDWAVRYLAREGVEPAIVEERAS